MLGNRATMNKIEEYKKEKDGLDILQDIPRYAAEGWEKITDGDKERLKWAGVFFRRQTPGRFMMRLRVANGFMTATQLRTVGEISGEFGKGFADITTRQQMQLRWFTINDVPEVWNRLRGVNLISLQTGMDNIRGVIGCPVAGLTPNELFDASAVVHDFTQMFLGNKDYTNLPRKFNVTITGCKEACTHAEAQDLAMTPAVKTIGGAEVQGFNVAVGGKMGSGGYRIASPLNLFVTADEAAAICGQIVLIFRDHGARELRTKARLAFLVEAWGVEKFRRELERRVDRPLASAGIDQRTSKHTDHVGVLRQKQAGLNYVGVSVPVGRMTSEQMLQVADLAENYGNGQIRLTVGQNLIIPNVPDRKIGELTSEPCCRSYVTILPRSCAWTAQPRLEEFFSVGVQKNNAIINLHLATGKIGKPGSGPFSLTGQPNAMGGREVGGLSNMLPGYRSVDDPQHREKVERHWGAPRGSIASSQGLRPWNSLKHCRRESLRRFGFYAPTRLLPRRRSI
jgi:ferredoxin-nitrite reductase